MIRRATLRLAALWLAALPLYSATKLLVTVVEQKSGAPVLNLQPQDFRVFDDKTPRQVESVDFTHDTLDIMLLLDTSVVGGVVQPLAEQFVAQLQPKEQLAVVAYHSSADLIQDFTSSRELIMRSLSGVKYGNEPHLLDALFAAIDTGFPDTVFRRVVLLLTSGLEGASRSGERDVVRLARHRQVSIYPVYVVGNERSLLEQLARQTGGASFNARDLRRASADQPGQRVFEVVRSHYTLTVTGNLGFGEKLRVEVKRPDKVQVSAMALE
ncbi:MAG TPA: VWA domain-containing protein [Bryobacteraceae bacterium]|nr:VWA domain-containing protein [Bryobacteraceae bacterium]